MITPKQKLYRFIELFILTFWKYKVDLFFSSFENMGRSRRSNFVSLLT